MPFPIVPAVQGGAGEGEEEGEGQLLLVEVVLEWVWCVTAAKMLSCKFYVCNQVVIQSNLRH